MPYLPSLDAVVVVVVVDDVVVIAVVVVAGYSTECRRWGWR